MKNEFQESMNTILKTPISKNDKVTKLFDELENAKRQAFLDTVSIVDEKKLTRSGRIESMSLLLNRIPK
jgi:hypothetical protein